MNSRNKGGIKDERDMPPPPNPISQPVILEPELGLMAGRLKSAVVNAGQIYRFYADTRNLGIQRHAHNPPRSLIASLGRDIEKFDQLCDSMESHLLRAIAALQRDLQHEEQRLKIAEKLKVDAEPSTQPASPAPHVDMTDEQHFNSKVNLLSSNVKSTSPHSAISLSGRRPSAISLSSLHRPAFPLKLDLSSSSLRMTTEEASMFQSGLASPVTLAPKSARATGPNELIPEFMAAFSNATADTSHPVEINLTMDHRPGMQSSGKQTLEATAGDTSDRPIELDLDVMDMDLNMTEMTDLFGDPSENNSEMKTTVDTLFSPIPGNNDNGSSANEGVSEIPKEESSYLSTLDAAARASLFDSLTSNPDAGTILDSPQALKKATPPSDPQSILPPPSPLFSFSTSRQHSASEITLPDDPSMPDNQFDLTSLDISHLFASNQDHDINFPMDILGMDVDTGTKSDVEMKSV